MSSSDLDPSLLAAIQEAVAAGMAAQVALPAGQPPAPALQMTTTPKLGLKLPALDDPALVTDLNDNAVILDDAITATVVATLYNKTLEAPVINNPTINGWTNAAHTHLNAASGGGLDGLAITSGYTGTGNLLRETATALVDPVVRDTIGWGAQPAGAVDTYLERGLAGRLRLTGSGAEQAAQYEARSTAGGTLSTVVGRFGQPTPATTVVSHNARFDEAGAAWRPDDITKPARHLNLTDSGFAWYDAVGADPLVWRTRMVLDGLGRLGLAVVPVAHASPMLQVGSGLFNGAGWTHNSYFDGTDNRAIGEGVATSMTMNGGSLYFYNAPSVAAGAIQAFVTRLIVDLGGNLGVGMAPAPVHPARRAIFLQDNGMLMSGAGYNALEMRVNSYQDTANQSRALSTNAAGSLALVNDSLSYANAPGVAAGALQTFTNRLTVSAVGQLTVNAATQTANAHWLSQSSTYSGAGRGTAVGYSQAWGMGELHPIIGSFNNISGSALVVENGYGGGVGGDVAPYPVGGQFRPAVANQYNCGTTTYPWLGVYAYYGTLNPSTADRKEAVALLDPGACVEAVLGTDWVSFAYRLPEPEPFPEAHPRGARTAEGEAMPDEMTHGPEDIERIMAWREEARARRLEEAEPVRHQRGYVLGSDDHRTHDLFGLRDRRHASPGSDLAVVACALQQALKDLADARARLARLEARRPRREAA